MLVGRWGILWRHLAQNVKNCTTIIAACAKLHNFCIEVCKLSKHKRGRRRPQDCARDRRADRDQPHHDQLVPYPVLRNLLPRAFTHAECGGTPGTMDPGPRYTNDLRHQTVRRNELARVLYHIKNGRRPAHATLRQ